MSRLNKASSYELAMKQTTRPGATATAQAGWLSALRAAMVFILLCGALYPFLVTNLGGLLFPREATGSLIEVNGKIVGSELVGQPFTSQGYFHGRPSAAS